MAKNNRVFIAFAIEDKTYRDFLVGQAKNDRSPFEFIDMSVKEPWDSGWKEKVRTRIRGCDGVIALLSVNTYNATGARFEIKVARDEGIPLVAMRVKSDQWVATPTELVGVTTMNWSWPDIAAFLKGL